MPYGKELRTSLAAFRKAVKPAIKTAQNTHFKSKYAPLDAVVEAMKEALDGAGLVVEQWTTEDGDTRLHTRIVHVETGDMTEESVCRLRIPPGKDDMPSLGAAQTYARRQQLLLAAMIAPEDDDGVSVMASPDAPTPARPKAASGDAMTPDTRSEIARLFRALKTSASEVDAICQRVVSKAKPTDSNPWTEGEGRKLVDELKRIEGQAT